MTSILSLPEDVFELIFSFLLFIPPSMYKHPLEKKQVLAVNIDRLEEITKDLQKGTNVVKTGIDVACTIIFKFEAVCKTWRKYILESSTIICSPWIYIQYFEKGKPLDLIEKILPRITNPVMREEIKEFAMKRMDAGRIDLFFSTLHQISASCMEETEEEQMKTQQMEQQCVNITKHPRFRKLLLASGVRYNKEWERVITRQCSKMRQNAIERIMREFLLNSGVCAEGELFKVSVETNNLAMFRVLTETLKEYPKRRTKQCEKQKTADHTQPYSCSIVHLAGDKRIASRALNCTMQNASMEFLKEVEQNVDPITLCSDLRTHCREYLSYAYSNLSNISADYLQRHIQFVDYITDKYFYGSNPMVFPERLDDAFWAAYIEQSSEAAQLIIHLVLHLEKKYGFNVQNLSIFSTFHLHSLETTRFLVNEWKKASPFHLIRLCSSNKHFGEEMLNQHGNRSEVFEIFDVLLEAGMDKATLLGRYLSQCEEGQNPQFLSWLKSTLLAKK